MIHIHPADRAPVEASRFNEAYMMHGSTSPFYPMIACLDVAASMIGRPGRRRTRVRVDSRGDPVPQADHHDRCQELARSDPAGSPWFFGVWQPDEIHDSSSGTLSSFVDTPSEILEREPACWMLEPGQAWHGFADLEPGYCMLDPIKSR